MAQASLAVSSVSSLVRATAAAGARASASATSGSSAAGVQQFSGLRRVELGSWEGRGASCAGGFAATLQQQLAVVNSHGSSSRSRGVVTLVGTGKCTVVLQNGSKDSVARGGGEEQVLRAKAAKEIAQSGSDGSGLIRSKLAVFMSGGGSNFRAIHSATLNNSMYGDVTVVISDKPGCKGCDYAREHGLPVLTFPRPKYAEDGLSDSDLVEALRDRGIDYILLAGYLKLLPAELVRAYPRSILNIHPSLLPSFGGKGYYGMKIHEAVIKSGARFSGATIHFVDEKFDTGPIVAQRIVAVMGDDTPQDLAAKVLKVEHLLYSEVVAALCEDRIFWRDDGVPLIRKSWSEAEYY